ncbi:MAG: hypothetical protein ABI629_20205, partial [bacterium]
GNISPTVTDTETVTPTETATPTPNATSTGTFPAPGALPYAEPQLARAGQRVTLDGRQSYRGSYYRWRQSDGDIAVDIENADQALASFVVPPLTAPATVLIELEVAPGFAATVSVSLVPENQIQVRIDAQSGAPGGDAPMQVRLQPLGLGVVALTQSLSYDPFARIAARADGQPDCQAGPDLRLDHASFAFTPDGCAPATTCSGLRAEVVAREAIPVNPEVYPSDAVVYSCRIAISTAGAPSCEHALTCAGASARDAAGQALRVDCSDGSVAANYAAEEVQFSLNTDPPQPRVGDVVQVVFSVSGNGGLPHYTLSSSAEVAHFGPLEAASGPLGEVRTTAVADCPGTTQLQLNVNYEAQFGCPGSSYFAFRTTHSPPFAFSVRETGTYLVSGRVAGGRSDCSTGRSGLAVRLDPLGWTTITDHFAGSFTFGGVPPGDYRIAVVDACSADGCYDDQAVHVADADVDVAFCLGTPDPVPCAGDCEGDRVVDITDLVRGVQIVLGVDDLVACPAMDANGDGALTVDELVHAINNALSGCS